jgi:hypothetical protein
MGCDIHAHTEIKINGIWHHLSELRISRDYALFTRMANIRRYSDEIIAISDPRGLPEDLSFLTKFIRADYGIDGHSDSWLSAAEVANLGTWMEARHKEIKPTEHWYCELVIGFIFGNSWNMFTQYPEKLPLGVEDGRMVFWFDD